MKKAMKYHEIFIIIAVISIFMGGCISHTDKNVFTVSTATQIMETSTPSSHTRTPIASPPVNTQTFFPASETPEVMFREHCLGIQQNLQLPASTDGVLFIVRNEATSDGLFLPGTYQIDMKNNQTFLFSTDKEELTNFVTSPNHIWMAYRQKTSLNTSPNYNLIVSNEFEGDQITSPWETDWLNLVSWLDDNHLLIRLSNEIKDHIRFLLYNPFTGQREIIEQDLPELYDNWVYFWTGWRNAVYNPSLSRVVYVQGTEGTINSYTAWDTINNQAKTSIDFVGGPYQIPSWSASGKLLAIALQPLDQLEKTDKEYFQELYIMDPDGNVVTQTNMTSFFNWMAITVYSWSPDGNLLAFWFSAGNNDPVPIGYHHEEYLGVFNVIDGTVVNYCVVGDYSSLVGGESYFSPAPLWSPDGKQLVIVNRYDVENHNRVILIDLESEQAYQIAENAIPVAWIRDYP